MKQQIILFGKIKPWSAYERLKGGTCCHNWPQQLEAVLPVDILLYVAGHVKVNHMLHIGNVETSSCHRRCDNDWRLTNFKPGTTRFTLSFWRKSADIWRLEKCGNLRRASSLSRCVRSPWMLVTGKPSLCIECWERHLQIKIKILSLCTIINL